MFVSSKSLFNEIQINFLYPNISSHPRLLYYNSIVSEFLSRTSNELGDASVRSCIPNYEFTGTTFYFDTTTTDVPETTLFSPGHSFLL